MGMDYSYMVLSKDRDKLMDLADYIYWRYGKDYEPMDAHSMSGYGISIFTVGEWHMLVGCHRKCTGHSLGWWLRWDDQSKLVDDVIYLEESPDTSYVRRFKEYDNTPLRDCDNVMDCSDDESEVAADLPADMVPYIRTYFAYGLINFAAQVTWRHEYEKSGKSRIKGDQVKVL